MDRHAKWRANNPEKVKAMRRAAFKRYQAKNPEKLKARSAAYRAKQMLIAPVPYPAPECCESCGRRVPLCLDHCHLTNLFRGWICRQCNAALGMVGDDPAGVRRLLTYIEGAYTALSVRLKEPQS